MKKKIAVTITILSFILILDSMNAGHALAMFLLAGVVPGTNIVLSADRMLELIALLTGFVFARISIRATQAFNAYRLAALNPSETQV